MLNSEHTGTLIFGNYSVLFFFGTVRLRHSVSSLKEARELGTADYSATDTSSD